MRAALALAFTVLASAVHAADRVRSRIHECLGAGRRWSDEKADCQP
jgi:hypothetical protein